MFTNYWYLLALGAMFSIITKSVNDVTYVTIFFIWLLYLFYKKRIRLITLIATTLSFIFFYLYIPSIERPQIGEIPSNESYHGKIISPIEQKSNSIQFTFQPFQMKEKFLVIHFYEENNDVDLSTLKYGALCKIQGEITVPEQARNPYQFDYQLYLLKNGITYQFIIHDVADIKCSKQNSLQYVFSLRDILMELSRKKLHAETSAWLQALVLGNDEFIDTETIHMFQRWSLSHILAISGLHIGIVVMIIYFMLVRFSIVTKEAAQSFLVMFLPVYAFLAGGEPSVWRASLMVVLGIVLVKLKVKLNITDIISIIFLLLIIINPYIVYHIGFQFSFLVSFGLIMSQKWLMQTKSNVFRVLQINFIAQMIILPLQVNYFYHFQPLSILLNFFIVPYFSLFVIPFTFLLFLFIYLPNPIIKLVEKLFLIIHQNVLSLIHVIDQHFYFPMLIGTFPTYAIVIYYLLLIAFMIYIEKEQMKKAALFGFSICLFLTFLVVRPYFSPEGTVTMLDIGQGDAFVIELPYRKGVFFIDAGAKFSFTDHTPTKSVYDQVIRPYLAGRGIRKIDAIFISHGDIDHNGSVNYIVDEFQVNEIIVSNFYTLSEEERTTWMKQNVKLTKVRANEKLVRNNHTFYTLAPERDSGSENENSLVLWTRLGGVNWLFTGDIDKRGEREIGRKYPNLIIDMLKVAHHGSNTSTDPQFIEMMKPKFAFISVGQHNRFGHPTKEVIETLENNNINIYRTDHHGAVQFKFKKDEKSIVTYLEN